MFRPMIAAALALALPLTPALAAGKQDGVAESGDTQRRGSRALMVREIASDPLAPAHAPRGHDVTIVFFSDYHCGYCRRFNPLLQELTASDPKLRILYRDWPILGAPSQVAARAAIAASFQGKHAAFHSALMLQTGQLNEAKLRLAARMAKVDWARLERDQTRRRPEIDALLARNNHHARAMNLSGTPAVLIGNQLVPGFVALPQLREIIAAQRATH